MDKSNKFWPMEVFIPKYEKGDRDQVILTASVTSVYTQEMLDEIRERSGNCEMFVLMPLDEFKQIMREENTKLLKAVDELKSYGLYKDRMEL